MNSSSYAIAKAGFLFFAFFGLEYRKYVKKRGVCGKEG
jgi:hypothetical protein